MIIYLETLGCSRNQVDSEIMLGKLTAAGHGITHDPAAADRLFGRLKDQHRAPSKIPRLRQVLRRLLLPVQLEHVHPRLLLDGAARTP